MSTQIKILVAFLCLVPGFAAAQGYNQMLPAGALSGTDELTIYRGAGKLLTLAPLSSILAQEPQLNFSCGIDQVLTGIATGTPQCSQLSIGQVVGPDVFPAQTANFSASAGELYHIDTTAGAITATMPSAPSAGQTIAFVDTAGQFATHPFTVNWNGKNFQGSSANTVMSIAYGTLDIRFNGTQWVQGP